MKIFNYKKILAITAVFGFLTFLTCMLYAFSDGVIGQTLKHTVTGCDCHGFPQSPLVNVTITGPDTVKMDETYIYTISMTGGPLVRGGFDIAVLNGILDTADSKLQKFNDELTHILPIAPVSGTVSAQFKYTAPSEPGIDSIYANGNSVNNNGHPNGDKWNFAPTRELIVVDPGRNLKLKVNIEANLTQDTINPQLRSTNTPYNLIDSKKTLGGMGTFSSVRFTNAADATPYYLIVKHRNSIETWSSSYLSFQADSLVLFDFTSDISNAYGNNMTDVNGVWSFYSGDVNQDGVIEGTDIAIIDNDSYNFTSGYVVTDLNFDEIVDGTDMSYADNNASAFVTKITP